MLDNAAENRYNVPKGGGIMKRWVFTFLIVFFSAVFLICGYFLLDYFLESRKQSGQFSELSHIMNQATEPAASDTPVVLIPQPGEEAAEPVPTEPTLVAVENPNTGETVEVLPEFVELYKMNPDIVGWITIPHTRIDYPVMQKPDYTDYYLYRSFTKEYSNHGCIYAREVCDVFTPSDNVTIYGHRMGDGTMFNALHDYADEEFYEEHRYITFNTLRERRTYEILAVFRISSTADNPFQYHQFVDAADEAEFREFVENCTSRSLYDTGVTAQYGDKLITLSTCEYTNLNGRLVVVAKLLEQNTES